jgi:hypothetical protein
MDDTLRDAVWARAKACCEYCRVPQAFDVKPFQIDHIIARQHGGSDDPANLALACFACNKSKGPNVAGISEEQTVPLFNPRRNTWSDHFQWNDAQLVGLTAIGKVTIGVLAINTPQRVRHRRILMTLGVFPPA